VSASALITGEARSDERTRVRAPLRIAALKATGETRRAPVQRALILGVAWRGDVIRINVRGHDFLEQGADAPPFPPRGFLEAPLHCRGQAPAVDLGLGHVLQRSAHDRNRKPTAVGWYALVAGALPDAARQPGRQAEGEPFVRIRGANLPKVNFKCKLTSVKTMTMLEFRRDARKALAAVERGERLILTYRGRAVAQLAPVPAATSALPEHDALRRVDAFAVDGPGSELTNAHIDHLVYGAPNVR